MEIKVREVCGSCNGDGAHCDYVGPYPPPSLVVKDILKDVEAKVCEECGGTGYYEYWAPVKELKTMITGQTDEK